MGVILAGAGSVFGAAALNSPNAGRAAEILKTVVEYVQAPPMPAPGSPDPVDAAREKLLAEHRRLAEAMYFEARGEGEAGETAVAEVIFHRLESAGFGRSICAIVYEGAPRPGCQFSFACDGSRTHAKSRDDWRKAEILAARILAGEQSLAGVTDNAMNYHAVHARPMWASKLVRTARIGNHIFYRPPAARVRAERD